MFSELSGLQGAPIILAHYPGGWNWSELH